ncbi:putative inactive histone-lysine N-methyltransferase [Nymphaea thermarum]|nr:putative inactive histone-lysine N-methyltransferase [Nymphaea thermarum]
MVPLGEQNRDAAGQHFLDDANGQGSAAVAPHSRFRSAVQAMRDIGIPSKTVKPVLRKLLEVYDDSWALIEEETYRALADAIFEQQDSQVLLRSQARPPFQWLFF